LAYINLLNPNVYLKLDDWTKKLRAYFSILKVDTACCNLHLWANQEWYKCHASCMPKHLHNPSICLLYVQI